MKYSDIDNGHDMDIDTLTLLMSEIWTLFYIYIYICMYVCMYIVYVHIK